MLPSIFGENMFDDFFDGSFDKSFFGGRDPLYGKHARNMMKTDIREKDDSYELIVDLPGFKKDEVSIDVKDGLIRTKATRSAASSVRNATLVHARAASTWAM